MKKKLIACLLVFMISNSSVFAISNLDRQIKASKKSEKYSTSNKFVPTSNMESATKTTQNSTTESNIKIKDPKLIKISNVKPIPKNEYQVKLAKDKKEYLLVQKEIKKKRVSSVNINASPVDFYNTYRVAEKIIRANNLDYVNWRICILKSTKSFNAMATAGNLIIINSALYDSLYNNPDALAFIIGHEMAHHILGHMQRQKEINRHSRNSILAVHYLTLGMGTVFYSLAKDKFDLAESREMEYMADSLSAELITRAGFSMEKGMEAINFINALPHLKTLSDTHPQADKRIENLRETMKYIPDEWVTEGKVNIYNSDVLHCEKSSDRVSIIILKSNKNHSFYKPETPQKIIKRIAYIEYKQGNMIKAIEYFDKLTKYEQDYIPYLYISYANEYLYKSTKKKQYLDKAISAIKQAQKYSDNNTYITKQEKALKLLESSASNL